ncbi:hypothetical protein FQS96_14285 [Enterococcus faecalis]|uniref:hypothetical protein n=1 Tax=Enterococcus TaxID=1350 RepID=UPI001A95AB48|nr:hypothetical protein [Enterococcus faecalis]MBO1126606.1 hypothetical protein [Enterococcus faecalis]
MELQVSRKSKFFCLAMALLIALGMFISAGTSVYAAEVNNDISEEDKVILDNIDVNSFYSDANKGLNEFFSKAVSANPINGKLALNEIGAKDMFGEGIEYEAVVSFIEFFNSDNNFNELGRFEFRDSLKTLAQGNLPIQTRAGGALAKCAVEWAKNTFGVGISVAAFKSVLNTYGYAKAAAWLAGKVASSTGRKAAAVLTLVWTAMTCAPIEAE